jgi:hypothetical protein
MTARRWHDFHMRCLLVGGGIVVAAVLIIICGAAFGADLPDARLTPGKADPALTAGKLCAKTFRTSSVRAVSQATKRKVYAAYHMAVGKKPCPCEIDHLISLEIGGSNDPKNLWPQSFGTKPWNAHVKDRLENQLHKLVCAGQLPLADAQHQIAADWIAAYKTHIGTPK